MTGDLRSLHYYKDVVGTIRRSELLLFLIRFALPFAHARERAEDQLQMMASALYLEGESLSSHHRPLPRRFIFLLRRRPTNRIAENLYSHAFARPKSTGYMNVGTQCLHLERERERERGGGGGGERERGGREGEGASELVFGVCPHSQVY